ncbi:Response regulator receiver domain-containing protein [Desulfuromusa kysingii]|uniref:Response regulator receiver domain-containing protein n=1 Tax=Desulfuromusa kysingii TaxID=37625 RepID=A0A1H4AGG1_9BACT|nr:response regulator [Desulfuromusa kysingii]SEA34642.1 Response regulator receiver domain-containing protein [Desulfuromusa kysingii]
MPKDIKILCVDDERNVLKAFRRLFMDEESFEILLAESGKEGLEILKSNNDIRLVISDYRMPEMTGVEFLRQVNEKWPETIRIVLSGYADTVAVVEAVNLGQIYKFIPKPWDDEELLSTIKVALQHQELRWENNHLNNELKKKNLELEEMNIELKKMNGNLEHLVAKRTEALELRNHVLQLSRGILNILPVAVYGIDAEQMIVHCNEYALELFPCGKLGPLGHDRQVVFSADINLLLDGLEKAKVSKMVLNMNNQKFYCEARRLHERLSQGSVLVLIPELHFNGQ